MKKYTFSRNCEIIIPKILRFGKIICAYVLPNLAKISRFGKTFVLLNCAIFLRHKVLFRLFLENLVLFNLIS